MESSQPRTERERRLLEYQSKYSEQLRLMGFIKSLEKDNEHIELSAKEAGTKKAARRANKLKKINNKDIKKYEQMLSEMPQVPEFK